MAYQTVILDKQPDGVAILKLNRPEKLNAINREMIGELVQVLDDVRQDDAVRVLVLTGMGRGFCSGSDISSDDSFVSGDAFGEFGEDRHDLRGATPRWVIPLAKFPKPTIAAVNGVAAGAGFSMALGCDIRIASEAARFVPVWIKRGLIPEGGSTFFLPRLIGLAKASEIVLSGDALDAEEAARIGLVNRLVPADRLDDEVRSLAARIAANPPITIELAKQALAYGYSTDLVSAAFNENRVESICHMTEDHREGLMAFREKREPKFRGK